MLTQAKLLFLFLLIFCSHDYHVSKCEITFNSEKARLEICQFMFLDDLEYAFEHSGYDTQHLCTELEKESADSILTKYIANKMLIKVGSDTISLNLLGKEISNDLSAVNVYLYSDSITTTSSFDFESSILLELFDDQNNMVYWTSGSGKKSYFVLNSDKTNIQLPYE